MLQLKTKKCFNAFTVALTITFFYSYSTAQITKPYNEGNRVPAGTPDKFKLIVPKPQSLSTQYNFNYYSIKEGLSQQQITRFFADSRNRLWVGTYGGGINLYNGETFEIINKKHGLSNDIVWDFTEDNQGRIWIATDRGLNIYDGKTIKLFEDNNKLGTPYIWNIMSDSKGKIWIGTAKGGVSVYENGKLKTYNTKNSTLPDDQIWDVIEDLKGDIWMGTHENGIAKLKNGKFEAIRFEDKGKNNVRSLICDKEGRCWFGTSNGLLCIENGKHTWYTTENGLPNNIVKTLYEDQNGIIWIGTFGGVAKFDKRIFEILTKREGLSDNIVNTFYHDKWNTMWFGTNGKGLCQTGKLNFTHYTALQGLPTSEIFSVYQDKINDIWLGTYANGLIRIRDKQFFHYHTEQNFKWDCVKNILQDSKGNYWYCTNNAGIIKFDGESFYQYSEKQGLRGNNVFSIVETENGDLWISTDKGVNRFDGKNFYHYNQSNGLAYYLSVSSYRSQKNEVWLGSFGGGVSVCDGKSFTVFNDSTGLKNNTVYSMCEDRFHNIWFANYGAGISILHANWKKLAPSKRWKYINITNGLPDDGVLFVGPDKLGNIWAGTTSCLAKINTREKNIFEAIPTIRKYGFREGFTGMGCQLDGFLCAHDNKLWIPSYNILSVYDPVLEIKNTVPPSIQMKSIRLKWENVDWNKKSKVHFSSIDLWNNVPKELELLYTDNHIQFDFIGITYDSPQEVTYQWKMEGFENKWTPWTKKHEVSYNLTPNTYTLKIKARNADLVESKTFTYFFTIHKPYWQTWWFRTAAVCCLLFAVYIVFRWRTSALRKRQVVLEKTVEERTIEVVRQKEMIEEKQKEVMDSIQYAKRIQQALLPSEKYIDRVMKKRD